MEFSPQQDKALQAVASWLHMADPDKQVFRLFGFAGSGKTSLAKHFAEGVEGEVLFGALTGKAASVLKKKGCVGASTIHSLIYTPKNKSRERLVELYELLDLLDAKDAERRDPIIRSIEQEKKNLAQPFFVLNEAGPLCDASLVIIDECSMVDERIGRDLLSFGKPILVLGDPAQLPPVFGGGFFTEQAPDVMLTEIHRQARDNPIIRLATEIRQEGMPKMGTYGDSRVMASGSNEDLMAADQVLVGRNKTRHTLNRRIRKLLGRASDAPVPGDRLVCLKNNHPVGLMNGSIWNVTGVFDTRANDAVQLELVDDECEDAKVSVTTHTHPFHGLEIPESIRGRYEQFDYGYGLTVHKSQGSGWPSVLVIDEGACFRDSQWRWRYTAVTRASEKVTLVLP